MRSDAEDRARKMFLVDVEGHRMTVLKDEGLYRHVRFGKPNGSSMYRFDLVTWPGHLVITGDFQDYHFARLPDMFEFFRSNPDRGALEINAHYWAEKLVGHHQQYQRFSSERYKQLVTEAFREWDPSHVHEQSGLWRAIREELLDDAETIDDNEAHRRLQDFRYRFDADTFEFTDSWEWDLRDYDHHYLVSLHAIVWGIAQWDTREHKTEAQWLREDLREKTAYLRSLGDDEKGHIARFNTDGSFNVQHPLHERVGNQLLDCAIHERINEWALDGSWSPRGVWNFPPEGQPKMVSK